ncbi:MAG TPA: cytochrome c biogenesis protein CcdA [Candidatus Baltobacteraceae bacterium]|nr:cytochrome c biogenesis protein CcdA [Candidatus Baltobacteraceae bacterium]
MVDPFSMGLAAVSTRSVYAPPLVFLAGAASSVGPCVAPRFIAVAGLTAGKSRAQAIVQMFAFVTGLTAAYASFGAVASLLGRATQFSTWTYAALALALALGGLLTLWRGQEDCSHAHARANTAGAGGALLLGASFALVVSPCCTPLVIGILTYTSAAGNAAYGSALLACFALGHALPVMGVALGTGGVMGVLQRYGVRRAAGVVSATLMLGLAAYYAVLA